MTIMRLRRNDIAMMHWASFKQLSHRITTKRLCHRLQLYIFGDLLRWNMIQVV